MDPPSSQLNHSTPYNVLKTTYVNRGANSKEFLQMLPNPERKDTQIQPKQYQNLF